MNKQEIINQLIRDLMYEDEWLEYIEATELANKIYENMFKEDEEDGI